MTSALHFSTLAFKPSEPFPPARMGCTGTHTPQLESLRSGHVINFFTRFSHLSLEASHTGDSYILSATCAISKSLQNEVQTAKKKKKRKRLVFNYREMEVARSQPDSSRR